MCAGYVCGIENLTLKAHISENMLVIRTGKKKEQIISARESEKVGY